MGGCIWDEGMRRLDSIDELRIHRSRCYVRISVSYGYGCFRSGRANICTSSVKCSVEGNYMQLMRIICSVTSGQLHVQCQMWTRESALHLLWRTGAATTRSQSSKSRFQPPVKQEAPLTTRCQSLGAALATFLGIARHEQHGRRLAVSC